METAILALAAFPATVFVLVFGVLDPWWKTAFGVHIMAYSAVVAVILDLVLWHRLVSPLPEWVWPTLYGCLALVIWHRLLLLIRTHWRRRGGR